MTFRKTGETHSLGVVAAAQLESAAPGLREQAREAASGIKVVHVSSEGNPRRPATSTYMVTYPDGAVWRYTVRGDKAAEFEKTLKRAPGSHANALKQNAIHAEQTRGAGTN